MIRDLRAAALLVATAAPSADADGRWLVNTGDAMDMVIAGLNEKAGRPQPIRVVLDLATLKAERPTLSALYNHEPVIGRWSDIVVDAASGVAMTLHLSRPKDAIEAAAVPEAVKVGVHLRNQVPLQASVGVRPGDAGEWQLVAAGESVVVNGRTFVGDDTSPLYVLRGGVLFETSVVEFGADDQTGQIAAKRAANTPEVPMSNDRLLALLKKYEGKPVLAAKAAAMFAAGKTDDEIARAAETDEKDQEIASLKAKVAELETAKAAEGDDEKKGDAKPEDGKDEKKDDARARASASASRGVKFGAPDGNQPVAVSRVHAQNLVLAGDKTLKGRALVAAARARFPDYDALPPSAKG